MTRSVFAYASTATRRRSASLVRRYQVRLIRYLTGRLGNEEEAVEAAQEAVVRAYCTLKNLKKPESFYSWLLGIAGRVAKETRREDGRYRQIASLSSEPAVEPVADSDETLDRAVADLPEIYREVILLRYYGGLSCAEVACKLGTPVGTITMRLSRAYALLRERLAEGD